MANRRRFKTFYSAIQEHDLTNSAGTQFGRSVCEYQILKRTDVSNLTNIKGYLLHVKQRLVIPNQNPYQLGITTLDAYNNYPAIIHNVINVQVNNGATLKLSGVFPRTLNSNVTVSGSSSAGTSNSVSHQSTSGSSTSNVNTFGFGISGGLFGDSPVFDVSLSYSHSWIDGTTSQTSSGTQQGAQAGTSSSNTMSVKDWSAYSQLSDDNATLSWIWGQSYPWDVILYNKASSGDNVTLPKFVVDRLVNNGLILPPSELSLFGLDFTSQAAWVVDFPDGVVKSEAVSIFHDTTLFTASHSVNQGQLAATLQSSTEAASSSYSAPSLDMSLYSLAPIGGYAGENIATIGFKTSDFTYAPTSAKTQFKIISPNNDLQVSGAGFDSVMVSTFADTPEFDVYFKVDSADLNHELVLSHSAEGADCEISWTVNGKFTGVNTLNKVEPGQGQSTETVVALRDLDYVSLNFQDYLVLGLNKVTVKVQPTQSSGFGSSTSSQYTLFSVAVR